MPTAIEQLRNDALSDAVDVTSLLRRALVIATKLGLTEFRDWVRCELDGYRDADVPDYRRLHGQVVVTGGVRRQAPIVFEDHKMAAVVEVHELRCPIGPIQEMLRDSASNQFGIDFPPELQNLLMQPLQMRGFPLGIPQLLIGRTYFVTVLDAVRNAVLNWCLRLEADGIRGESLDFSPSEIEAAKRDVGQLGPPVAIHVGTMIGSTIQQASPRTVSQ